MRQIERSIIKDRLTAGMDRVEEVIETLSDSNSPVKSRSGVRVRENESRMESEASCSAFGTLQDEEQSVVAREKQLLDDSFRFLQTS